MFCQRCFAYWCTSGKAHLGDNIDNIRYPNVQVVDLEAFFKDHRLEDLDKADQILGL